MKILSKLKRNPRIQRIYNSVFARPIMNVKKTQHGKRALLSYSVYPFKKKHKHLIHPNYIENYVIVDTLDDLGFTVDVYNNIDDRKIAYDKYDLIVGEGLPVSNYFTRYSGKTIHTIYYATGSHPFFNNNQSYSELFNFFRAHKKFLRQSARIVDSRWGIAASLSQDHIIIGNDVTKASFLLYSNNIHMKTINPPFYIRNKTTFFDKKDRKKFLWFGSYGLIHKGLHHVLEAFLQCPDIELHICGYLDGEQELLSVYKESISNAENIHLHGFVSLDSSLFKELMESCSFVILSSVAEGCSTAIITAMGNGGLIPVITPEVGISTENTIFIRNNTVAAITEAINEAQFFSKADIISKSIVNQDFIIKNFSENHFRKQLSSIFTELLTAGDQYE